MIVNEGGKKLPKLTTPGTSADLLTGKELIDQYGRKIEGSMPINSNEAPIFDTTELEESGRLRARAIYRKGFYNGGNSDASYYLPTQAGTTITPGTETITAVPSGKYTLGAVEVAGDSDLKPENIKKYTYIFGVGGTYDGPPRSSKCTFIDKYTLEIDENDMVSPTGSPEEIGMFILVGLGTHTTDNSVFVVRLMYGLKFDMEVNDPEYPSTMDRFLGCYEIPRPGDVGDYQTKIPYKWDGQRLYMVNADNGKKHIKLYAEMYQMYEFSSELSYYITYLPGEDVPT